MSMRQMKYKVRRGTIDSGKKYESKVTALLSLRCVLSEEDMWISSNADGVGALDDIILHQGNNTFMLQLKHKDEPKPIVQREFVNQKNDFALQKYFQDIINLKECIESKGKKLQFIDYLGSFDNICFVLFTNRDTKVCYFLEQIHDELLHLNTSGIMYRINASKVLDLVQVDRSKVDCFDKVYLFPNQIHARDLEREIEEEIQILAKHFDLEKLDIKYAAKEFIKFVTDWAEGILGGHYCLSKHDIICKLTELFCNHYEIKLIQERYTFYKSETKHVWNKIIQNEAVTVVDYEDNVLRFLLEYLGSEVVKYCGEANYYWKDSFSRNAQTAFYRQHCDLKMHMLKIVGNHGRITLLDVYKCLWMDKQLPLLLEIKKLDQYHDILNILKLASYNYKVIIINNSNQIIPLPDKEDTAKVFRTVKDLNQENRREILKQEVKLQGRSSATLEKLVDEDMLHHIKCKDVIKTLMEQFSIGNNLNPLPAYFIPRCVSKIFLMSKVLEEVTDEIFLIEESSENHFKTLPVNNSNVRQLEEVNSNNINNCEIILTTSSGDVAKLKSAKKPVHHLIIHNENYLEWKTSFKSVRSLRRFQVDLDNITESNMANKFCSPINIVSAVPGMGKSVLMDYVALRTPTNKWVLRIDLNGHQKYYKSNACKVAKALDHLEYFKNCQLDGNAELSNSVFKKLLKTKDIVILLDAFDEVSLSYKHEVTNIAKCLYSEGYMIWITTRPHMNSHLEKELDTFFLMLKSFTRNNQKEFLTNYFYPNNADLKSSSKELLHQFVENLLKTAEKNLNDWDAEFTGIPLQTKLLADVFKDDCINYVTNENLDFNENFDLLYLYQNFIDKKIDILCEKFGPSAEDIRFTFKEHQSLFALKLLFSQHKNLVLYERIIQLLNFYYKDKPDRAELLQREGVVTIDSDFNVNFVHRTFGEFLAAQWLADNVNGPDEKQKEFAHILIKERFGQNYKFLFGLFDRILAKDLPLHLAVINNKEDEIMEIINLNPKFITDHDKGYRTVLHLLALYSNPFPQLSEEDSNQVRRIIPLEAKHLLNNSDKMLYVVKKILNHINYKLEFKIDLLGYSPLDYSLVVRSLTIAEEISTKFTPSLINANINLKLKSYYLISSILLDYSSLFNVLLPYFASRELLLGKLDRNGSVQSYVKNIYSVHSFSFSYNDQNYLIHTSDIKNPVLENKFKDKTILQLIQPKCSKFDGPYSDIRHAICFGHEKNFEGFLSSGINHQDADYNTPLHYAVLYRKPKIVELLLAKHVDVNKQNSKLETPLHLAFSPSKFQGKLKLLFLNLDMNKIVVKLVAKGADTNVRNIDNNTPLHLALQNRKNNWAKLFIANGASVGIQNKLGETALHIASTHGYNDILTAALFRSNNIDVDVQDNNGQTPLFSSIQNNHLDIVELLLSTGADVSVPDKYGLTALHLAASLGYNEILTAILTKGTNVYINIEDNHGQTPLFSAVRYNHIQAVQLLLANGADVNIRDKNGLTVFQRAAPLGYNEILSAILEKGCDINAQNKNGETALLCAAQCNKIDTVKLLLDKGAEVNVADKTALTPFHFFARCGYTGILSSILIKSNNVGINVQDNKGQTPLLCAAQNNHIETVKLLLVNGADVNNQDKSGLTTVHLCAHSGYEDIVNAILNSEIKIDINAQDNKGQTPLFCAALNNQINTVKSLLVSGADVNIPDKNGLTPLHLLAGSGYTDVLSKAITCGGSIDINVQDNKGQTPLFCAAEHNHIDVIKLLLVNGANVNIQEKNGLTSLHLFARYGYLDILTVILSSDISIEINVQDNKGQTPLFYAALNNHKDTAKLLLSHGASANIQDKTNLTPVHLFACSGFTDVLSLLLRSNAITDINVQDSKEHTPIFFAAQNNHIDVVKLLFSKGADIHTRDKDGVTPLHLFARCGYEDILSTILKSGTNIDVNVQDNKGQTPLFSAVENNHIDTVKLLLCSGAEVHIKDKNGLTPFHFARVDYTDILSTISTGMGDTPFDLDDTNE